MREYLRALQERQRDHNKKEPTITKVGAVVLLKEDTKNRAYWRLGRVVSYIHGVDETVRGLQLKLGNGYIVERPLQLVCDLEVGGEVERHSLNPDAPELNPRKAQVEEEREPRARRRAKYFEVPLGVLRSTFMGSLKNLHGFSEEPSWVL